MIQKGPQGFTDTCLSWSVPETSQRLQEALRNSKKVVLKRRAITNQGSTTLDAGKKKDLWDTSLTMTRNNVCERNTGR